MLNFQLLANNVLKQLPLKVIPYNTKIVYLLNICQFHRFTYFTLIFELFDTDRPFVVSYSLRKVFLGLNSSLSIGDLRTSSSSSFTLLQAPTFFLIPNNLESSAIRGSHSSVISVTIFLISYKMSLS